MRVVLDRVYAGAHWLACAALCVITLMVVVQVGARVVDALLVSAGLRPFGFIIPSLAEFAGFMMVGATFLALASTLKRGVHIRVTVALGLFGPRGHRLLNIIATLGGAVLFTFVAWHGGLLALDAHAFEPVSYGIIPVPLWIPQSVMALGLLVFAIALLDEACETIRSGTPSFEREKVSILEEVE